MMRRRGIFDVRALTVFLAVTTLAACAPSAEKRPDSDSDSGAGNGSGVTATVPDTPPSITGSVTAIGPGRTLRIEENPGEKGGSAKAQVRVPDGTAILERSGAARTFDAILAGQRVSMWFSGPMAESYPVQATARVIVLEPARANDSTVTATGFGPVRAGMTLAQAEQALGARLEVQHPEEPCTFVFPGSNPSVALMVVNGRIARVDIRQGTVKTAEGAGLGDLEERIHALYPGRVEVQPHKYTEGHYLIVRPAAPADSAYRLIFETDGRRVTKYRAGRMPEVSWVEGCS